jgi:hypothetical protein
MILAVIFMAKREQGYDIANKIGSFDFEDLIIIARLRRSSEMVKCRNLCGGDLAMESSWNVVGN